MNILLICCGGISTSLVRRRMEMYCQTHHLDYVIRAEAEDNLKYEMNDADVILVAPQLTHHYDYIRSQFAGYGKAIALIPSQDYGLANGENLVRFAEKLYEENRGSSYENDILEIITASSKAKQYAFDALDWVEKGHYLKAALSIKTARKALLPAHRIQSHLIEAQMMQSVELNILCAHAQDHLMSAVTTIDLVERMIRIFEKQEAKKK